MVFTGNSVNGNSPEPNEIKPFAKDWYVTAEDIIQDIVFSSIDKRVMKEHPGNDPTTFIWQTQRIVGITYNNNHSYDISIRILVPDQRNNTSTYETDLVKVKIFPSCDSPKIGCKHGLKVEVLEYTH